MDTAGVVTNMQQLQSKDEIKWDGINNYANIDKKTRNIFCLMHMQHYFLEKIIVLWDNMSNLKWIQI